MRSSQRGVSARIIFGASVPSGTNPALPAFFQEQVGGPVAINGNNAAFLIPGLYLVSGDLRGAYGYGGFGTAASVRGTLSLKGQTILEATNKAGGASGDVVILGLGTWTGRISKGDVMNANGFQNDGSARQVDLVISVARLGY